MARTTSDLSEGALLGIEVCTLDEYYKEAHRNLELLYKLMLNG